MGYLAGIAVCGISFLKKDSKIAYIITFLYAWILFGFNTGNLDYLNYKGRFEGSSGLISEPIFLGIMKLFRKAGFSYQGFLVLFALTCLSLISVAILKYSPYPAVVLCLYLIFPFCLDTVQIRFFLASSIFVCASCLILKYNITPKPSYILWFVLLILTATGIHYSAVFYLIFLVLFLDKKRHGFIQYILIPVGITATCAALPVIFEIIGSFIGMQKANSWIGSLEPSSMTRIVRLVIIRGGMMILCIFAKYMPWREDVFYDEDVNAVEIDHILFMMTLYAMLFTFFEIRINSVYERLTRPGFIFGWLYVSRRIRLMDRDSRALMLILMTGLTLVNFYMNLFRGMAWGDTILFKSVFLNLFQSNAIFR